jgi:hypothetical protein
MRKYILFFCIFVFSLGINGVAQKKFNLPIAVDSLATGNYKDVLNSFFQLAIDKIIGSDKAIKFTSNPYAVMAKMDTSLLLDREYYKYRHLRDLNFSVAAKLDSSYKFNGFSSGIKYALINRRDETVSRLFLSMVAEDKKTQELFALNNAIEGFISTIGDATVQNNVREEKTKFFKGDISFNQLSGELKQKIVDLAKANDLKFLSGMMTADAKFNIKKTSQQVYNDVKTYFNNRLLWTIGITDTTYKDQFMFSNIVISSELLKGIDSMKNADAELNVKAAVQYVDDSTISGRDLKRSIFSIEPGINFVLKNKNTEKSVFEFKLSGSYYHTFKKLYPGEDRNRVTLNGTIRIRIINDIWIPIEIKYDPGSGNVFGFLNVRANFSGLRKFINGTD